MRIISISSGKGGVGKTTVAMNLAAALHSMGRNVVLIDCNLTASHLALSLGMFNNPRTINNFLRKEAQIESAIQTHHSGLRIVPASLELSDLAGIETESMKEQFRKSLSPYDFVLLDSAPGIGREALIALRACDEAIFVTTPYIQSVVDAKKLKSLSNKIGFANAGLALNMVQGKKHELDSNEIERFTELPVIAKIPADDKIMKCANSRTVCVHEYPKSKPSRAFFKMAALLSGYNNFQQPFIREQGAWRNYPRKF